MKKLTFFLSLLLASGLPTNGVAAGWIQNKDVAGSSDITTAILTTTGNLSSISPCIASPGSVVGLAAGQFAYDTTHTSYIPATTTITAIPGTCSAGQIQLSQNSAGTATADVITFGGQTSQLINDTKMYVTAGGYDGLLSALLPTLAPLANPKFTGNVGIGTTAPSVPLEVNGAAKVDGNLTASAFIGPLTGNASTATTVTTNAAMTGDVTSTGSSNATTLVATTNGTLATLSHDLTLSGSGTGLTVSNNELISGFLGVGTGGASTTGIRIAQGTQFGLFNEPTVTNASSYGIVSQPTFNSTVTTGAISFNSAPITQAASFTLPYLIHYGAGVGAKGAGSVVTNEVGFDCLSLGFGSNIACLSDNNSSLGSYFINQIGTTPSTFGGRVGIGTTNPAAYLHVLAGTSADSVKISPITGTNGSDLLIGNSGNSTLFAIENSGGGNFFGGDGAYSTVIGSTTSTPIEFYTNSTQALKLDASQNATFAGLSNTMGTTANPGTNAHTLLLQGSTTSNANQVGLLLLAGTNSSDYSMIVGNAANSVDYLIITGAGKMTSKNNTLDDGSGSATFASNVNVSGTITPTNGILGTTAGGNATAGDYGEYISCNPGSNVSVVSATGGYINICSMSLTAGDWDVQANVTFQPGSATNATSYYAGISTLSGGIDAVNGTAGGFTSFSGSLTNSFAYWFPISRRRLNVSSTTTIYLIGATVCSSVTGATWNAGSFMNARRVR